jgi:hypothetical protein
VREINIIATSRAFVVKWSVKSTRRQNFPFPFPFPFPSLKKLICGMRSVAFFKLMFKNSLALHFSMPGIGNFIFSLQKSLHRFKQAKVNRSIGRMIYDPWHCTSKKTPEPVLIELRWEEGGSSVISDEKQWNTRRTLQAILTAEERQCHALWKLLPPGCCIINLMASRNKSVKK